MQDVFICLRYPLETLLFLNQTWARTNSAVIDIEDTTLVVVNRVLVYICRLHIYRYNLLKIYLRRHFEWIFLIQMLIYEIIGDVVELHEMTSSCRLNDVWAWMKEVINSVRKPEYR